MTDTYTFVRLFTWAKNWSFFVKLISMTFALLGTLLNSQMYAHHNFRNIKMLTVLYTILNKLRKQLIFFVQSKVKLFFFCRKKNHTYGQFLNLRFYWETEFHAFVSISYIYIITPRHHSNFYKQLIKVELL